MQLVAIASCGHRPVREEPIQHRETGDGVDDTHETGRGAKTPDSGVRLVQILQSVEHLELVPEAGDHLVTGDDVVHGAWCITMNMGLARRFLLTTCHGSLHARLSLTYGLAVPVRGTVGTP